MNADTNVQTTAETLPVVDAPALVPYAAHAPEVIKVLVQTDEETGVNDLEEVL